MKLKSILEHFKLLKRRTYAVYFVGQLLSMSGTFMQRVAQSWLVYRISESSLWLGLIAFMSQFPSFLISPIAGVVADHFDRRKILIAVQIFALIQAGLLAALTLMGVVEIWHIVVLACALGLTDAFERTARHSFSVEMVGKRDLPSATALNSFIINTSKIVGPSVGGLLIGLFGEGWCFAINSASYLAVLYSLIQFSSAPRPHERRLDIFKSLKDGMNYVRRIPALHFPLLFAAFLGVVEAPSVVLLPVYAKDILHGDSMTLGWLSAFYSLGALLGAISAVDPVPKIDVRASLIRRMLLFAICVLVFALSRSFWLSAITMAGCGFFMIGCYPMINNAIQFIVADQMRSRVLALYTMTFLGTLPISGLIAGSLAERFGAQTVLVGSTVLCGLVGVSLQYDRKDAKALLAKLAGSRHRPPT